MIHIKAFSPRANSPWGDRHIGSHLRRMWGRVCPLPRLPAPSSRIPVPGLLSGGADGPPRAGNGQPACAGPRHCSPRPRAKLSRPRATSWRRDNFIVESGLGLRSDRTAECVLDTGAHAHPWSRLPLPPGGPSAAPAPAAALRTCRAWHRRRRERLGLGPRPWDEGQAPGISRGLRSPTSIPVPERARCSPRREVPGGSESAHGQRKALLAPLEQEPGTCVSPGVPPALVWPSRTFCGTGPPQPPPAWPVTGSREPNGNVEHLPDPAIPPPESNGPEA